MYRDIIFFYLKCFSMYKSSFYNIIIPVPETKEVLVYNTFHGGVIVLNDTEKKVVSRLKSTEEFELSTDEEALSLLKKLVEKEYFVEGSVCELEEYKKKKRERAEAMFNRTEASIGLTIGASSRCNMACSYCFEFDKPNCDWNDSLIDQLEKYVESIFAKSPQIKKWDELGVVWYGGEPLLGLSAIQKLTPLLLVWAEKYGMQYHAKMVTNGILLTSDTWKILTECKVELLQVTIDGVKEIHNRHRPLRNAEGQNYERILENLSHMPEGMLLLIRVNTDYEVVERFDEFLDDLEAYGIWPQRYKDVRIMPEWLRTYEQAAEKDTSRRINRNSWELVRMDLSYRMVRKFNRWAEKHNKKKAKFIFKFPRPRFDECICLISPYVITVGADGYTYKCWEYIHEKDYRVQSLSETYQMDKYGEYLKFNKENRCSRAARCKFFPICEATTCLARDEKTYCLLKNGNYLQEIKNKYLQYCKVDEPV